MNIRELESIKKTIQEAISDSVKKAIEKQTKENSKNNYDKRLRNTRLLLENYNKFIEHCENSVYTKSQLEKEDAVESLDELYEVEDDMTIVQAILKSKKRTEIMVEHIKTCLEFYTYKCINSRNTEKQRRADAINLIYIKEKLHNDVAEELHVSNKTLARDRKKAIEEIAPIMFGVDGVKLD